MGKICHDLQVIGIGVATGILISTAVRRYQEAPREVRKKIVSAPTRLIRTIVEKAQELKSKILPSSPNPQPDQLQPTDLESSRQVKPERTDSEWVQSKSTVIVQIPTTCHFMLQSDTVRLIRGSCRDFSEIKSSRWKVKVFANLFWL